MTVKDLRLFRFGNNCAFKNGSQTVNDLTDS